ncbi:MAG TPA: hypothetical protein VMS56_08240 [Thermoanaerobaculia bacterium]|nr:hypothetical protein [Thermoanaerobaculia bacterium]
MEIVRPVRVTRTYNQRLFAEPNRVFPLLCPVLESQWVEGWDPRLVISESGIAERDCVFVTGDPEAIWVVTEYVPPERIEFVKVTPGVTASRITIGLERAAEGETRAEVIYSHTALGPEGERYVAEMTEDAWLRFITEWEEALNRHLGA